jgi:hypothetical protein
MKKIIYIAVFFFIQSAFAESGCYVKYSGVNEIEACLIAEKQDQAELDNEERRNDNLVKGFTGYGKFFPKKRDEIVFNNSLSSGVSLFQHAKKGGGHLAQEFTFSFETLLCREEYAPSLGNISCHSIVDMEFNVARINEELKTKKLNLSLPTYTILGNRKNREEKEFQMAAFHLAFIEYSQLSDSFLDVKGTKIGGAGFSLYKGKFDENNDLQYLVRMTIWPLVVGEQSFAGLDGSIFSPSIEVDAYKQFNPRMKYLQSIKTGLKGKDSLSLLRSNQLSISPYLDFLLTSNSSFQLLGVYEQLNIFKDGYQNLKGRSLNLQFNYTF